MSLFGLPPATVAIIALILVILGSFLLLIQEVRAQRMSYRITSAMREPQHRRTAAPSQGIQLVQRDRTSLLARLTGLIALDLSRPQQHPAPWPIVILVAVLIGIGIAFLASPLLGGRLAMVTGIVAAILAARASFLYGRTGYREKLLSQLPDAMGMIVRALKAGIPVNEAIRSIARESPEPTRREFTQVSAEQAIGVPLDVSLLYLYNRTALREYGFFAVTIALQQQTGGSLTETLENLADVVRKRVQTAARGRALAGQARTSAVILAIIPFVALGALTVLNPGYISFYFTHEKGPTIAAIAFSLLGAGILTMRFMIRRSLSVT
jgi:tight adherence protein B